MNEIIHIPNIPEILTAIPRSPDQNPAFVYLISLPAKSGRKTQAQVIERMASWLGGTTGSIEWGNLRYAYTIALKTKILDAGYSPASARKFLSALRGILKQAWRLGQINAEDYAKAVDLGKVGGSTLPAGRYVSDDEMHKIFDACLDDHGPLGARDAAMFAILFGCGLRREEIASLDIADYRPQDGTLTVHGKRGKDRLAYITNGTLDALTDWLLVRGSQAGPLFLAVNQKGELRPDRCLSNQAIYNVVHQRANRCGLEKFSPHSLRRSFCTRLLEAGVDISIASKLMGHAGISTTALYDKRGDRAQQEGVKLLHIPYHKPKEVV